jgi:hypothetical protein
MLTRALTHVKNTIGENWFPGLTLTTLLNWDLYCNRSTFYIKIEAFLKYCDVLRVLLERQLAACPGIRDK